MLANVLNCLLNMTLILLRKKEKRCVFVLTERKIYQSMDMFSDAFVDDMLFSVYFSDFQIFYDHIASKTGRGGERFFFVLIAK